MVLNTNAEEESTERRNLALTGGQKANDFQGWLSLI